MQSWGDVGIKVVGKHLGGSGDMLFYTCVNSNASENLCLRESQSQRSQVVQSCIFVLMPFPHLLVLASVKGKVLGLLLSPSLCGGCIV